MAPRVVWWVQLGVVKIERNDVVKVEKIDKELCIFGPTWQNDHLMGDRDYHHSRFVNSCSLRTDSL